MEATNVIQKDNILKANFTFSTESGNLFINKASLEYLISGSAKFQMMVNYVSFYTNGYLTGNQTLVFLRFTKRLPSDENTYIIKFTSKELGISGKRFITDDGTWRLIYENKIQQFTFDVDVHMDVVPSVSSFASLHDDTELTDFELRGEDGSVQMHRAVLAAASPVLRRMLVGAWRETAEGHVDVPGTSTATLQNFKNYLYMNTLPESGLEDLLLLSCFYMMPRLEQRCVDKLVHNLNAKTGCDLIEFAVKHNVKRLLLASLNWVQSGEVNVDDMVDYFMRTKI